MNMSLYGYPRLTNPNLSKYESREKGFIKFENVLSTHTHTSPSLLEALSIGIDNTNENYPIDKRRRISLIDILEKTDISTEYISNQGSTGTHHQAASIIFNKAKKTFPSNDRLLGNYTYYKLEKPWDHIFLMKILMKKN